MNNNFVVEVRQEPAKGLAWLVLVYKKRLGFRRQISSDWFLDEGQAKRFANQLAEELRTNPSVTMLRNRKAGWTLRPAAH